LVLTASCVAAFKVPAARPAIVWRATMTVVTVEEQQRRETAFREVLGFAEENEAVGSLTQCSVIIARKTTLNHPSAHRALTRFKNSLPQGDPLRAAYDAVVARSSSAEGLAASNRLGGSFGKNLPSIADMREARVTYAARPLPSLTDSGQQLAIELQRGVAVTAATPQKQLEGLEECACNEAFEAAKASFEERVGIVESVGATNVPENGYGWVSARLIEYAVSLWDAEHAKNERAIQMEGVLQDHYNDEMRKMAEPRRAASRRGREQAHASRFDAHGGHGNVLQAPVALTKAPGSFVSSDIWGSKHTDGSLVEIADTVEAAQKIRAVSRVICFPNRGSALYQRLRPTALSKGSDRCSIKERSVPAQIQ